MVIYIVYYILEDWKNRKLKLKYSCYIEAEKGKHPHIFITKTMVRIIAELSVNTPTACSGDRYRYRFGYTGGGAHGHGQVIYNRPAPAPAPKSSMSQKKTEKEPLLDAYYNEDNEVFEDNRLNMNICSFYCMNNNISNRVNEIEDTISQTNLLIMNNRLLREKHEKHEKHEIDEKLEKEKEKQKEEELKKAKEKEINHKLGKIIYRSRTGDLFEAQHSIQTTTVFVFDKKTGKSTQTLTQKVVWNDKVFETKQDWFSEMASLSAAQADVNMKVVKCE